MKLENINKYLNRFQKIYIKLTFFLTRITSITYLSFYIRIL